jgi:hypothetical protein
MILVGLIALATLTDAFANDQGKSVISLGLLLSFTVFITSSVRWFKYGPVMKFKDHK